MFCDKISLELTREREFRGMLEHRLDEVRTVSQQDMASLEREIGEGRRHISILQLEVDAVKEEKESALNRAASTRLKQYLLYYISVWCCTIEYYYTNRLELDAMEASCRLISKERDSIRAEAQSLSITLKENIDHQQKLQTDFNQQIFESNSRVDNLLQQISSLQDEREKLVETHEKEKHHWSAEHEAALKISQTHLQSVDELRKAMLSQASEIGHTSGHLQQQVQEKETTIRDLEGQLKAMKDALQNEKTEAAALQLRLKLHENNQQQQQQRQRPLPIQVPSRNKSIMSNDRVPHHQLAVTVDTADEDNDEDEGVYDRRGAYLKYVFKVSLALNDTSTVIAAVGRHMMSPAFSEDLGPASFSSSMLLMPLSPSQSPRRVDRGSPTGFDHPRSKMSVSGNHWLLITPVKVILLME